MLAENAELKDRNAEFEAEKLSLVQRVDELERRMFKNSRDSGMPPSSDGLAKPAADQIRTRRLRRKSGGQPGQLGATLMRFENPDEIVDIFPETCDRGESMAGRPSEYRDSRQVVDIPVRMR